MKFIVSSTGLYSHLQAISRVINSKNSLPILDCFLMELVELCQSLLLTAKQRSQLRLKCTKAQATEDLL